MCSAPGNARFLSCSRDVAPWRLSWSQLRFHQHQLLHTSSESLLSAFYLPKSTTKQESSGQWYYRDVKKPLPWQRMQAPPWRWVTMRIGMSACDRSEQVAGRCEISKQTMRQEIGYFFVSMTAVSVNGARWSSSSFTGLLIRWRFSQSPDWICSRSQWWLQWSCFSSSGRFWRPLFMYVWDATKSSCPAVNL